MNAPIVVKARLHTFVFCVAIASAGCSGHGCGAQHPSAADVSKATLAAAVRAKGPNYVPHTRHVNPDGTPKYTNRLILEASPYLIEHAHNPVDWYAWGDAAFARAQALGRPIFLSIGYSTCHWCHVMADESFEDEAVAAYMNEHYVSIKVDREERPDVDAMYMTFVQLSTGRGGWPMSMWLTANREPFFAGTYFAPKGGRGGPGFLDVLSEQWSHFSEDSAQVAKEARFNIDELRVDTAPEPAGDFPSASLLLRARAEAQKRFDPNEGGTAGAPKFPSSFPLEVLLRVGRRASDSQATAMVATTLSHMDAGGIHDQVGGGFHRYATDGHWLVPHFEKMLYDNALLATAYLDAWQATGAPRDAEIARETLDYLLRDLQSPDGTFYSATDADSADATGQSREGAFFTWTPSELTAALGADDARVATAYYGVTIQGAIDGRSILHTPRSREAVASDLGLTLDAFSTRLLAIRGVLLAARSKRPAPFRDDKIVVSWNALAIRAFARAAIAWGEPRYADAAVRAAAALLAPVPSAAHLSHWFVDGKPLGNAFADDYAGLAAALVDVFELTGDSTHLDDAIALEDALEASFLDAQNGGYFLGGASNEPLLVREKTTRDGPTPTASSLAASTELRLFALTGVPRHRERAERTVRAFAHTLDAHPLSLDHMLLALDWATDAPKELVIVVSNGRGALAAEARPFLDALGARFVPNASLVVATADDLAGSLGKKVPFAADKTLQNGATAYVCEHGLCKLPTRDPKVFADQASEVRPYPK